MMNRIGGAFLALFLCLSLGGCSTFETLGDYVSENPLIAQVATRQAVAQYIAEGHSIDDELQRAEAVQIRIEKVLLFLDGDPKATPADLLKVIDSSIDWSELNYRDRILVQSIVSLVEKELESANRSIELPDQALIVVSVMLETAIEAAQIYINRSAF